jgi:hypothetical protein
MLTLQYKSRLYFGLPGVGIFFKFDLEALGMTIRERTTSLYQFLIRLAGVIGTYFHLY